MYFGVLKKKTQASKVDWISFHPGTISIYVAGGGYVQEPKYNSPFLILKYHTFEFKKKKKNAVTASHLPEWAEQELIRCGWRVTYLVPETIPLPQSF